VTLAKLKTATRVIPAPAARSLSYVKPVEILHSSLRESPHVEDSAIGNQFAHLAWRVEAKGGDGIEAILRSIRKHLGMDVAFIAEFGERDRLFRHVDARGHTPVKPGDRVSLEMGYCQRVVDGRLPQLITESSTGPTCRA
jgi:hypothetical protein